MTKEIKAQVREITGKGASGRLRKDGFIPGIMYSNKTAVSLSVNEQEFNRGFKKISDSEIINLVLDKKSHKVMIKEYQRDYIRGSITHLDFLEITKDSVLRIHVPIHLEGTAAGTKEGGILEHSLHEVEVECKADHIPEQLVVDVTALVSGHAIHVRDLKLPKGVKVLSNAEQVVASITHAKVVAEAAPAAAEAAAPAAPAAK